MNKQQAEQHWQKQVDYLNEIRLSKGISQNQIAEHCQMSQQAVNRFFKKQFCPTARVMQQIADAIGYDLVFYCKV
jgi:transcriptional regulator with XRE-family HTH domain